MSRSVIINSGGNNLASVQHALERLGIEAELTTDAQKIQTAERVLLPGVGTAKRVMDTLRTHDLIEVIKHLSQPLLGICVGMQVLFQHSEEGDTPCLGLIDGNVQKMQTQSSEIRLPHMGWNALNILHDDPLFQGLPSHPHAYFVHGYAAAPNQNTTASSLHGQTFAAVVRNKHIVGIQCHPERSGKVGATLLRNFFA